MKKLILLFLLFATLCKAQNPTTVFHGGSSRSSLDSCRLLVGANKNPILSLGIGDSLKFLMSHGAGILPTWETPFVINNALSIGDTVLNSVNYGLLNVNGTHHLSQISLIGTTDLILTSNGTGAAPTFQDGGLVYLVKTPNVSHLNDVLPNATGVVPLRLKTAISSDTNAFEVWRYDATKFFIIDSGGKVNTYRGFNLNTTTNPLGLYNGSVLDYGTSGYVMTSQGTGATPQWTDPSTLPSNLQYWTESQDISGINTTVPVSNFIATNGGYSDIDASISPLGNGALLAQKPDNAVPGGIKRGIKAVDFQMSRTSSNNVASGDYSGILSGSDNRAANNYSISLGGRSNFAVSDYSAILSGYNNAIDLGSDRSVIIGGRGLEFNGMGGGKDCFGYLANPAGTHGMIITGSNAAVFGNVDIWLGSNDNSTRALYFWAPQNSSGAFPNAAKYVGFSAGAITTSVLWTLPLADGSAGQILATNGSGVLSWANSGSGAGFTLAGQNYLSLSGTVLTANAVNLSGTNVTSTLPVSHGGTGQTTLGSHEVLLGNGTGGVTSVTATASNDQILWYHTAGAAPITTSTPTFGVPGVGGSLTLAGSTSGLFTIQPVNSSWVWTPPATGGTNGYYLQTDGTGVTSWIAGTGAMVIGNTVTSGTAGSVLFLDGSHNLAQDNPTFIYDVTNGLSVQDITCSDQISSHFFYADNLSGVSGSITLIPGSGTVANSITIVPHTTSGIAWNLYLPKDGGARGKTLMMEDNSGSSVWHRAVIPISTDDDNGGGQVGDIDATVVAATTLFTPSSNFVVTGIYVRLTAFTAFTVDPTISVGTNNPNYDDLFSAHATNLQAGAAVNEVNFAGSGGSLGNLHEFNLFIPSGTAIKINVSVGATATVCTLACDIIGYYL